MGKAKKIIDMFRKKEKIDVTYEQVIISALLKFNILDNVDVYLLLQDIRKKFNIVGSSEIKSLSNYISTNADGVIYLNPHYDLYSNCDNDEAKTLKEQFEALAGDSLNKYFNKLDKEGFVKRRLKFLKQKKALLEEANILLISDNEIDYQELKKYGFKKVDYFKSIIRANNYFLKHPDEIHKYHIILKGNICINAFYDDNIGIENAIRKEQYQRGILSTRIWGSNSSASKIFAGFNDSVNRRYWKKFSDNYSVIIDSLVESALINDVLSKVDPKYRNIPPIKEYVNPKRLFLPEIKSELNILYLQANCVKPYSEDLARKLGLNITFLADNDSGLWRRGSVLGSYDIIIASEKYSRQLIEMNNESTEQCKDTGRILTLLVTYDSKNIGFTDEDMHYNFDGLGNAVTIKYISGGELALNDKISTDKYCVSKAELGNDKARVDKKVTESIICHAVNIYDFLLALNEESRLEDLDFPTIEDYTNEYLLVEKAENERQNKVLEPIRMFDKIKEMAYTYIHLKKAKLIGRIEGLKITESPSGICVENILDGRTFCAITFTKDFCEDNIRMFTVETTTKKGTLSKSELVGVYTPKFDNLKDIPNRPNEKQMNAVISIYKKMNYALKPMLDVTVSKYTGLEDELGIILERTKKEG